MAAVEARVIGTWRRARRWPGLLYGLLLAACVGLVALGASLEPDARGHGTHEQLGVPPCLMASAIGYPCPFCGFTTALAHMARGRPGAALAASLFGTLAFIAACSVVVWTLLAIGARRDPTRVLGAFRSPWCWGALVAAYFASWAANIVAVMAGWKVMQ
ncbi:MAG: DUF2752 domain-containing protein [Planctomycetes bacterium]|nr:DUF2752 domain-containing protein [Planctomycetota bacterium]